MRMMYWVDDLQVGVYIGWVRGLGTLSTKSRGEVAATFEVKGEKTLDRYSVWSLCCDDLNSRGLPTSQYQTVSRVIREWRMG